MLAKINVLPIISGHLDTLKNRDKTRFLIGDLIGFYGLPVIVGTLLTALDFKIVERYVNIGIVAHTIFIPLLVNVLFLIYSVKDRGKIDDHAKRKRLLDELYQNVAYAVLVSILSLMCLSLHLVDSLCPTAIVINRGLIFILLGHLLLTILMIVKRTYVLLQTELGDSDD